MAKKTSRQRLIQAGAVKGADNMTPYEQKCALYWLTKIQEKKVGSK